MGHIFKWLGSKEQAKQLWENREALDKYLARLKELMEQDRECEIEQPKETFHVEQEQKKEPLGGVQRL